RFCQPIEYLLCIKPAPASFYRSPRFETVAPLSSNPQVLGFDSFLTISLHFFIKVKMDMCNICQEVCKKWRCIFCKREITNCAKGHRNHLEYHTRQTSFEQIKKDKQRDDSKKRKSCNQSLWPKSIR